MSRVHPAGPRHADVLPEDHPAGPAEDLNALEPAVWPRGARREDGVLTVGGVDAYVTKPFDPNQLIQTVRKLAAVSR